MTGAAAHATPAPAMHDIKALRADPQAYDRAWARKGLEPQAASLLALDEQVRAARTVRMNAEATRNTASKAIGAAKAKKDEAEAARLMGEVAAAKAAMEQAGAEEAATDKALFERLAALPNLPADDVPDGTDEHGNVEEARWGEPTALGFEAKDHVALGEGLGLMDFEAAARISGARFVVLKGALARLERALGQFMLDIQTSEHGYTEASPPLLVRDHAMFGTGQLPKAVPDFDALMAAAVAGGRSPKAVLEAALDAAETAEQFWLIPTAEVSLTNLVREQILEEESLPLRYTALTPCFRAEAGSAGRDTRGMIRQHQFWKTELVSITTPEQSQAEHVRMTQCAEAILQRLGLPYRRMLLCAGDMGFSARKTYDLEVWLPGQNAYREISSCSNCGDFQARRMNARAKAKGAKETRFVHTLNGSGLAVGRTLVAVMENYQTADGAITIPQALQPYLGGLTRIG
jgi:seryl-tRNA synthetase